ncbi:hypothetical protein GCM10010384_55500 [Streptomyces djakartensis]|uniref:Uncharacterized protein n=1 Tax=Streptomyces djakartensis TaxID=68193 RepID=A0ABQ3AC02_9ACTN|nr:hypothetical protein GCM10010384_55500 [Streptomyces djakartensis]
MLDQPVRGAPLAERAGVGQRGTAGDHRPGRLDAGPGGDERVQDGHVVVAGGPVQRSFLVRALEAGVGIGPGGDECGHHLGPAGKVTGPVGRDVQQTACALAFLTLLGDARGR